MASRRIKKVRTGVLHGFCPQLSHVEVFRPFVKAYSILAHVRASTGDTAMWHYNFVTNVLFGRYLQRGYKHGEAIKGRVEGC